MLVLSRKRGEALRIGKITIRVLSTKGGKIRLGVEAPPEVAVHREEVQRQIAEAEAA